MNKNEKSKNSRKSTISANFLLSIDLGTMNFAYCLLHIPTLKIVRWDVVKLANSMKEPHENICTKLATILDELKLTRLNYEELKELNIDMDEIIKEK
jgi:hypothetical protein